MGIVMGDSVCPGAWSRMMGSANASDQDAKVLRRCAGLRGLGKCQPIIEPFGEAIELGMRGEGFGRGVLHSGEWSAK
jgi:hypothetical protein